jgi:hypothetical protein
MTKKTEKEFYLNLEKRFKKVQDLQILKEIDIENEGWENSGIMTKLAIQLTQYLTDGELKDAVDFMETIERALENANDTVTNYIYTDFLVTIMEQKKRT